MYDYLAGFFKFLAVIAFSQYRQTAFTNPTGYGTGFQLAISSGVLHLGGILFHAFLDRVIKAC